MAWKCNKCGSGHFTTKFCTSCKSPWHVISVPDAPLIVKPLAQAPQQVKDTALTLTPVLAKTSSVPPGIKQPSTTVSLVKTVAPQANRYCNNCKGTVVPVEKPWPKGALGCPNGLSHVLIHISQVPHAHDIWSTLPTELWVSILSWYPYLDEPSLLMLALVCKRFRNAASYIFRRMPVYPPAIGYASSTDNLQKTALQLASRSRSIAIAVDKFSDTSVLEALLKQGIQLDIVLGTSNEKFNAAFKKLASKKSSFDLATSFKKMHNKYWVFDYDGIFMGSPNISYPGLVKGNSETCIYVRSPFLAKVFLQYLDVLKKPNLKNNDADLLKTKSALVAYNSQRHGVRAALAPAINISDFIAEELDGAVKITVRQFLIGRKDDRWSGGTDLVGVLMDLAENGCEIDVYIDEGAYENPDGATGFVKPAVEDLMSAGINVYTQKPVFVVDASTEKIMHDKLILAEFKGGYVRTLIGSAGITRDVIANYNAEGFLALDYMDVFKKFSSHHATTLQIFTTKTL